MCSFFDLSNFPNAVASTLYILQRAINVLIFFGEIAITIRSCDSETQISQGERPGYLREAFSRWIVTPVFSPISPIAEENPHAPQSRIARIYPLSRAFKRQSNMRFSS